MRIQKRNATSTPRHNRSRFLRLGCERLEDRSLLAVLFGATGGNIISNLYTVNATMGATTSKDVVLGESGNDQAFGGAGQGILIGGIGVNTLRGEAHDDILIGGTTDHDSSTAALAAILSEWANTTRSYTTRVANIRSGGGSTGGERAQYQHRPR